MFDLLEVGRRRAFGTMARMAAEAAPVAPDPHVIQTGRQVDDLIRYGYHRRAVSPSGIRGMSERAYRALWPDTVRIPAACVGRFDKALLVDPTIGTDGLARLPFDVRIDPSQYRDVVPGPELGSGRRYVRFVTYGQETTTFSSPRSAEKAFRPDQVGLTGWEGLHLFAQHPFLRTLRFATDRCEHPALSIALCGSRYGWKDVPALLRTNHGIMMLSRGLDACENRPGEKGSTRMEWTASGHKDVIILD